MHLHQNTLYVTTEGAYVARRGETIAVSIERETRLRVPAHHVGGIVCFGRVSCSPSLMAFCADRGIGVSFMSSAGRFYARVEGPRAGNVLLRRAQFRASDDERSSSKIARAIVVGKILNARAVLMRALRDRPDHPGAPELDGAARRLLGIARSIPDTASLDLVRGMEGDAARTYFRVFNNLITVEDAGLRIKGRTRRPPLDPVNAVLSFLYTLLMHDIRGASEAVGLDPAVGFLHRDRPGRYGLALDLMEEWRPVLADRTALSLFNRGQLSAESFTRSETGEFRLNEISRKVVLTAWQERKRDEITHPFLNERMSLMLAVQTQARLLARHLRGDLDGYPVFLWK